MTHTEQPSPPLPEGEPSPQATRRGGLGARLRRRLAPLLDMVVPPLCLACHTPMAAHDTLCPDCWRRIDFIRPPLCDRLGLPLPYDAGPGAISARAVAEPPVYARARAVARFDGVMRDLVHDLKFHDRSDGLDLFGRWMTEAGGEVIATADVLVPIPLHRLRLLKRRFNQSALLANEVSRRAGLAVAPLALVRTRRTRAQPGLTREQRRDNVRGAFAVPARRAGEVQGRRVLLIDDVVTTGATVSAAARALLDAGASSVDVLSLALVTGTAATDLA